MSTANDEMAVQIRHSMNIESGVLERMALGVAGVAYAFGQRLDDGRVELYCVIQDNVSETDAAATKAFVLTAVQAQHGEYFNTVEVKVVTQTKFNNAVRATLSRNYELEVELKRVREITPDVDSALRTLELVIEDPSEGRSLDVTLRGGERAL